MNENSKVFLFSTIVASHVVFILYWAYFFLQEIRVAIRKRLPSLYVTLFLCCQERKLERELHEEAFQSRISPFLANLDKVLYYLERRRTMYNSGEIPLEDEGLRRMVIRNAQFVGKVEQQLSFQKDKNRKSVKIADYVSHKNMMPQLKMRSGGDRTPGGAHGH
jgi:hypothetical protein